MERAPGRKLTPYQFDVIDLPHAKNTLALFRQKLQKEVSLRRLQLFESTKRDMWVKSFMCFLRPKLLKDSFNAAVQSNQQASAIGKPGPENPRTSCVREHAQTFSAKLEWGAILDGLGKLFLYLSKMADGNIPKKLES